jgi:hypothetical protein
MIEIILGKVLHGKIRLINYTWFQYPASRTYFVSRV